MEGAERLPGEDLATITSPSAWPPCELVVISSRLDGAIITSLVCCAAVARRDLSRQLQACLSRIATSVLILPHLELWASSQSRGQQVNFDLSFQVVDGQWRLFGIAIGTPGAPALAPQAQAPAAKQGAPAPRKP
jgi:hypothetical protein